MMPRCGAVARGTGNSSALPRRIKRLATSPSGHDRPFWLPGSGGCYGCVRLGRSSGRGRGAQHGRLAAARLLHGDPAARGARHHGERDLRVPREPGRVHRHLFRRRPRGDHAAPPALPPRWKATTRSPRSPRSCCSCRPWDSCWWSSASSRPTCSPKSAASGRSNGTDLKHAGSRDARGSSAVSHVWTALRWQGLRERAARLVGAAMCPAC
jgi:hypothetical protein